MNLERREFLRYIGVGAVASTLPSPFESTDEQRASQEQKLHPDYQSNNPGTEYYLLGNGHIIAALQVSPKPEYGTHCGLLVMSSEHFGRKISTYLYHPERGLQNSRFFLAIDGKSFVPEHDSSNVRWEYPDGIPTIVLEWNAGGCTVREEFTCPINDSALVRTVTVTNAASAPVNVLGTILLYPNLMYFDEYRVDRVRMTLTAAGYQTMQLFSMGEASVGDRHMNIRFGEIPPGEQRTVIIVLTLNQPRDEFEKKGLARMMEETKHYWQRTATMQSSHGGLDHLFSCSKSSIRCAVARSGKTDGGIWQYNLEWVRDQSMIATGAVISGLPDASAALLRRILTESVDDEGKTVDASRHRPPETIELDQNGELLHALWMYWAWTGDDSLIKEHWKKVQKVAEYALQPVFRDPTIGLLKNSREFWERDPAFGVKEGYELTYQVWNIVGLEHASHMAARLGESENAKRWSSAATLMKKSFLSHPKFSLVDEGRFIKRRLATGEVQRTFEPPNRKSMPPGSPLRDESISYCDPDAGNVTPIMLGVVDAKSSLATKTLESMEHLWNQRWMTGGYARYDVSSEPDSPGPWPFATMFIARSYFEAGNDEKVWRALNWLLSVQGGKAGAWLEYYGDRQTPPLPPVGIVVWTWAEILMFFVHHLLGVRPNLTNLVIRPRLLRDLNEVQAKLVVHGHDVALNLKRAVHEQFALVDGRRMNLTNGSLTLPLPTKNISLELNI